jgi:hypothetical protein
MVELADIFRDHGAEYRARFGNRMLPSHLRAMDDIEQCRTEALGGSVFACPSCPDVLHYSYHSCGNRACPKCGNDDTSRWLELQRQFLLPTDYFLVTYTLPDECRAVARANQWNVYSAFFSASAETFIELAGKKKHLGGKPGLMGVLQTWRRDMAYHVHTHYLVPGGALSEDHSSWQPHRYGNWLLPEKALAARFKDCFQLKLDKLGLLEQVDPAVWTYDKKWIVDCKPAGNGQTVLKYLAPYVHRVAISNNRIVALQDGKVTFCFKDRDNSQWRYMTLSALQFIARFLQHVLPKRFIKIRYYGFLAAKLRNDLLPVIRQLLPPPPAEVSPSQATSPPAESPCTPIHSVPPTATSPAAAGASLVADGPTPAPQATSNDPLRIVIPQPQPAPGGLHAEPPSTTFGLPDGQLLSEDRSFRRCPNCARPMVLVRTLPRLDTRPRGPPA